MFLPVYDVCAVDYSVMNSFDEIFRMNRFWWILLLPPPPLSEWRRYCDVQHLCVCRAATASRISFSAL